jgi:hypothetical protein
LGDLGEASHRDFRIAFESKNDVVHEVTLERWMLKISSMLLTHGRQIDICQAEDVGIVNHS